MSLRLIIFLNDNWEETKDSTQWILENTKKSDVFLSNEVELNPISTCTGRILFRTSSDILDLENFGKYEDHIIFDNSSLIFKNINYFCDFRYLHKRYMFEHDNNWIKVFSSYSANIYKNKNIIS